MCGGRAELSGILPRAAFIANVDGFVEAFERPSLYCYLLRPVSPTGILGLVTGYCRENLGAEPYP